MTAIDDLRTKGTILVLTGMGIPFYSAREIDQTLTPIEGARSSRRDVNGTLVDLTFDNFRKYASTISSSSVRPPSSDGIWPGMVLTVDCVAELSYPTGASGFPTKTVVPESSFEEDGYTFYRPRLAMMVMNLSMSASEWTAGRTWTLELEEV
jgi:hypothetical protein